MIRRRMVLLGLFLGFLGCQDKGLTLHVAFDQIHGLKGNDRVIFDKNHIGKVIDVRYRETGSFTVHVEIKSEFAEAVTEHARFFIVTDPADKAKKAIEMILVTKGGTRLDDGTTVSGYSKHSAFFNQKWTSFEKGLDDLKRQFDEFSDEFRKIPESDAYKDLERELERLSEEIKRASEAAHAKIKEEVLPRLKEELEKLREKLLKLRQKEEKEEPLEI